MWIFQSCLRGPRRASSLTEIESSDPLGSTQSSTIRSGYGVSTHAPPGARVDETTAYDQYLMQQGNEWEQRYVARQFPTAYVIQSRWGEEALRETLSAMLRGEVAISGGALWLLAEEVYGKADVLVRCDDQPSDLGDFHYRVKEVKSSKEVKPYHQLQAAVYNWMLAELQGFSPPTFDVVPREGEAEVEVAYDSVARANGGLPRSVASYP